MVLCHFSKRILETTFLHKFSAKQSRVKGAMAISTGYAFLTSGCMYLHDQSTLHYNEKRFKIGATVWAIGIVGNLYHHYVLSTLRSDATKAKAEKDKKKKYSIPVGGLFGLVWCPHYLFELVGWYGIAIVSNTFNYWLMATCYSSYLSGRAKSTEQWYLDTFRGDERLSDNNRKAILPFLY
eukprot:481_1